MFVFFYLNKCWNFLAFLFPFPRSFFLNFFFFLPALFSQYRNASLDITQASLSCSASAESNLLRSATARRIRLSFFSFTLKCSFFFQHPKYTRRPNCWHVCEERRGGGVEMGRGGRGGGGRRGQQDSCILSCSAMQKLHIVYLKNTEHFSTIKKHVI